MQKLDIYSPLKRKFTFISIFLFLLMTLIFVTSLMSGTFFIAITHFFKALTHINIIDEFALTLRFNRIVMAICCGGMLATGSAILQGLTRNPMVAPDLAGITSMGCLLIVLASIFSYQAPLFLVALGIIGAMLGSLLCFIMTRNARQKLIAMVLVGICIAFFTTALMQIILLKAPQENSNFLYFLSGSLYAINFSFTKIILCLTLLFMPVAIVLSKHFATLTLDDETAQSLGVPLSIYRTICYFTAAVLIGASIIGVGNMGFIGIVAPNLARICVGNRPQFVFPLSFLIGAIIYLIADTIGRCIITPAEIPAGIVASIISAPIFIYLIIRFHRGQHEWN